MRFLVLALVLIVGVARIGAAACTGTDLRGTMSAADNARIAAAIAATPYPEGNLWRAERDGAVIHILGTVHIGDVRLAPRVAALRPLVEAADLVFLELTSEAEARLRKTPELMLLPGPTTILSLMPEDDWNIVADALSARGMPPIIASRFQPFFLATILTIPPCALAELDTLPGVDSRVETMAQEAGVPLASLETVEEVMGLIQTFPMEMQLQMLLASVQGPDYGADVLETVMQSYLDQTNADNWAAMRVLSVDPALGGGDEMAAVMDEMSERLLVTRNHMWLPRLLEASAGGQVFAAVGAAHLPGTDGMLNLLAGQGFTLTRLPF